MKTVGEIREQISYLEMMQKDFVQRRNLKEAQAIDTEIKALRWVLS